MAPKNIDTTCRPHFPLLLTLLNAFALLLLSHLAAEAQKMYWTDATGIHRADLDGENSEILIPIRVSSPVSVAVDMVEGKIYWTDHDTHKIQRANLDGTKMEDLVNTEFTPINIAIDRTGQKIYWIAGRPVGKVVGGSIHRANLDGTGSEIVVWFHDLQVPRNIEIDSSEGRIYWTMDSKIYRANLDGQGIEVLMNLAPDFAIDFIVDVNSRKIYWAGHDKIMRANKDGTNMEQLPIALKSPGDIALDTERQKIYWKTIDGTNKVQRANLDGTGVETIFNELLNPSLGGGIALDLISEKLYWTNGLHGYGRGSKIQRANLDGTAVEDLLIPGLISPEGIAIDVSRGKMYWVDFSRKSIHRANFDGTGIEALVTQLADPRHIALDLIEGKIYWTDFQPGTGMHLIQRANLDGTDVQEIVVLNAIGGIAIDAHEKKLYWASPGKIQQANLDGTGIADVVIGLRFPQCIAIDVDGGKIYWTHETPLKIQRANLDGTGVEDLIMNLPGPEGIAVDSDEGKIYWTQAWMFENNQWGFIRRANLDGTNVEDLLAGLDYPHAVALDILPTDRVPVEAQGKQPVLWGRVRQNALLQNFPNPFNPETWIPFRLAQDADVTIQIYDLRGQTVRTLSLGRLKAGFYEDRQQAAYWDGSSETGESVSSGIYFYQLRAGDYSAVRRMVILK